MLIVILNLEVSIKGIVIERFRQTIFHKQASLPIRIIFDTGDYITIFDVLHVDRSTVTSVFGIDYNCCSCGCPEPVSVSYSTISLKKGGCYGIL